MLEDTLLRIAVALETIAARPWPTPQADPEVKPAKKKKTEVAPLPVDTQPVTQPPVAEVTETAHATHVEASPSEHPAEVPAPDPAAIKAALTEALTRYTKTHSRDELVDLLGRFGAKRMADVQPKDHRDLLAAVEVACG